MCIRDRYVTEDHHGLDWPVTHDDESGWWRASTVSLEGDRTGDGIADFFIEYTNYADPSTPNGYVYMMADVIGSNYQMCIRDRYSGGRTSAASGQALAEQEEAQHKLQAATWALLDDLSLIHI